MRCNAIGRPPGSQIAALIFDVQLLCFCQGATQDAIGFFQGETHRSFPPPGTLMFPRRRDYSAARHRAPLPVRLNRAGRERNRDIDLFFDYKRQKGKVDLFDLVDVKELSRSSSTMTRAFCQLSAAARFALPAAGAAGS